MSNMLGLIAPELSGPIGDFLSKLAGPDATMWFAAFKRFLRKENPWPVVGRLLARVTLGTHKTAEELEIATKKEGNQVSPYAAQILKKVTVAEMLVELELVAVTGEELGFKKAAKRSEIYAKAQTFGLQICSAEVGPQLRRVYKTQRKGEWLLIAMDPIADSGDDLRVFIVEHDDGGLCLRTGCENADGLWGPGYCWVFVRPAS